jgi:predicted  nucleic acid-binding Zn-ribbon protein
MLKLYENKTYLVKKEQHEKMLSEQRAASKELHQLKCKLEELNKNDLGKWPEIEATKKQYLKTESEVKKIQGKEDRYDLYRDIVEEQRPEAINRGLEINKQILTRLTELENLKGQYLKLEDEWKQYNGLAPIKTENVEDTIGPNPYYAVHQKHNPIFEGFKKASEAYQKRNEKL